MNKTVGIILAVLLLLVTLNSTYFFLGMRKVKIVEWLVFNACAPSSIAFLIGFILYLTINDRTVLHMSILPVFFFWFTGLLVFPWSGYNIIAQISHLIMTMNIGWAIYVTFSTKDFNTASLGMLLGIMVFSAFIAYQQTYVVSHPEDLQKILGIEVPFSAKDN